MNPMMNTSDAVGAIHSSPMSSSTISPIVCTQVLRISKECFKKKTLLVYLLSWMSHSDEISMIAVRVPFEFSSKNWAIVCPTMFSKFPLSVYVCASLYICQKLLIHSCLLINVNVTYKEGFLVTIFL
jgi:hypothetical protein